MPNHTEPLVRFALADIEIRSSAAGRTIAGICVPFDTPTQINDLSGSYIETFKRGAFAKTIREQKTPLYSHHEGSLDRTKLPIGKAIALREDAAGLYGEFAISRTRLGEDVLTLVHDGVLDAFSIGFTPIPARDAWSKDRTAVERREVSLREVSVVTYPAFTGALITEMREHQPAPFDPDSPEVAPALAEARALLRLL